MRTETHKHITALIDTVKTLTVNANLDIVEKTITDALEIKSFEYNGCYYTANTYVEALATGAVDPAGVIEELDKENFSAVVLINALQTATLALLFTGERLYK